MPESMNEARELVERLRRAANALERPAAEADALCLEPADHVQHRPELAHLNRGWVLDTSMVPAAAGWLAPVRRRWKRFVARLVLSVLERYLLEERVLLANLVRFENELARKSDQLTDEVRTVAEAARCALLHLAERDEALHRLLEARIERLERRLT